METDRNELFKQFDPPPGGVARMRTRMQAPAAPRVALRWQVAAASCVLVIVLFATLVPRLEEDAGREGLRAGLADAPEFDRLLGRESVPIDLQVRRNDEAVEFMQLASTNPKVRIYSLN